MRENLKYEVIEYLTKKTKKYSGYPAVTTNNSKHFF